VLKELAILKSLDQCAPVAARLVLQRAPETRPHFLHMMPCCRRSPALLKLHEYFLGARTRICVGGHAPRSAHCPVLRAACAAGFVGAGAARDKVYIVTELLRGGARCARGARAARVIACA
jgi:hypothetical protein